MASDYKLYGYRWVVLAVFMFINATIQILWITYAPITGPAAAYYGVTDLQIGLLSMSFMIAFIPLSIPVSWVIDTYGFRLAVSIGAVLMAIFGLLRGFAGANYTLVLLSTFGIAAAQPFLLNAWTKVPANWFAIDERATAVGLVTLASLIGTALGMVLTPILTESISIPTVQLIYGGIAAFSAVIFIIFSRENSAHTAWTGRERSSCADAGWAQACVHCKILLAVFDGFLYRAGNLQWPDDLGGEHHPSPRLYSHRRGHVGRAHAGRWNFGRGDHPTVLRPAAQAQALYFAGPVACNSRSDRSYICHKQLVVVCFGLWDGIFPRQHKSHHDAVRR